MGFRAFFSLSCWVRGLPGASRPLLVRVHHFDPGRWCSVRPRRSVPLRDTPSACKAVLRCSLDRLPCCSSQTHVFVRAPHAFEHRASLASQASLTAFRTNSPRRSRRSDPRSAPEPSARGCHQPFHRSRHGVVAHNDARHRRHAREREQRPQKSPEAVRRSSRGAPQRRHLARGHEAARA